MAHFPPTDDSSQGSTSYSRISDPEEEEEEEEEQELHTTDGASSEEEEEEEHHRLQSRSPTPAPPARKVARKTPAAPSRAKPKSKLQQVSAGVTRNIVRRQIAYRKAIRSSEEEEEEYDDEEDVMARRRRGGAGKRKGSKKVKFAAAAAPSKRTRARKSAAPKKYKKSATDKVQTKRITALQKSNATLKKQIDSIKSTMKTIKGLTGTK
jgi:hypothetical protein